MTAFPASKRILSCLMISCALLALALPMAGAQSVGPSAPGGLVATPGPGTGEATLTWEPASSLLAIESYRIYRGEDGGELALVAEVAGDILSFTDGGLADGATYHYRVSATDALAEGPMSDAAVVSTFTLPGAPLQVAAAPGGGLVGEATVTWEAPASDGGSPVTGYVVYRDGEPVAEVGADARAWTDTGLEPLRAYTYAVAAVNLVGEGAASDGACSMASPWPAEAPRCLSLA